MRVNSWTLAIEVLLYKRRFEQAANPVLYCSFQSVAPETVGNVFMHGNGMKHNVIV
jgi:hypothetical protein